MYPKDSHLSDDELLLSTDVELPAQRRSKVRAHLEVCRDCQNRLAQLEAAMASFAAGYRSVLVPQLPQDSATAKFRMRLKRERTQPTKGATFFSLKQLLSWKWAAAVIILGVALLRQQSGWRPEGEIVPDPNLTPGETTLVSRNEVCQANPQTRQRQVPEALKQAVFREYGIKNAPRDDYEVDFLITPELGGSASLRNLWPQSYSHQAWNAHVKDALEERLLTLVCSGDLDLSTAQRELATNWVGAYKKYIQRDRPM